LKTHLDAIPAKLAGAKVSFKHTEPDKKRRSLRRTHKE